MQNLAQRRAAAAKRIPLAPVARGRDLPQELVGRDTARETSVVDAFVRQLAVLGVERAFGVSGGAIALLFDAIAEGPMNLHHFRHETGATFAATEAYFASGKPTLAFATTGPGLLNSLTGVSAARWEGAKLILVSGHTNSAQRGRWASQETSSYTMPQDLYCAGTLFDFAVRMESVSELAGIIRRLAAGLARPGGFVAHICLPMSVQSSRVSLSQLRSPMQSVSPSASPDQVDDIARVLKEDGFAIWAGFGARHAAPQVRELVRRSGARIFSSPRAKGIISEKHPQFLGVSGLGGHDQVVEHMIQRKPRWVLVLGSRLGEPTSFWDRDLLPSEGFVHVDIDPEVPGTAYPDTYTVGVQSEIGAFLDALLERFAESTAAPAPRRKVLPFEDAMPRQLERHRPVRPQVLMQAIQRYVVDRQPDTQVLAECGNAFAWCNHYLRFEQPGRYRVSTLFGSMGHAAAGVVGAAMAGDRKAVAVVGDGSMLMNSEVSTAAQYGAKAIWVVLNDAGYGMCRDGHRALGLTQESIDIPRVDFVAWARSMGADGLRVEDEEMLEVAFDEAMNSDKPFVLDVIIDADEPSPLLRRFESLIKQGNSKTVAGWEK